MKIKIIYKKIKDLLLLLLLLMKFYSSQGINVEHNVWDNMYGKMALYDNEVIIEESNKEN
jgi:hypothetical protein